MTELNKLGPYDGTPEPLDELTDRQREVIQTAYDRGYFEVPREMSAEAIAAELDLDQSTVVEHLQRAERNLLAQFLYQCGLVSGCSLRERCGQFRRVGR